MSQDPWATAETGGTVEGFDDTPAPTSYSRPALQQYVGRLLLFRPTAYDVVPNDLQPGTTQKRITTDIVVLDGDTITDKVSRDGDVTPLDMPVTTGPDATLLEDCYISSAGLVAWLKPKLSDPLREQKPWILGRVYRTPARKAGQSKGYTLGDPNRPKGTPPFSGEDAQKARAWLAAHPRPAVF